jgi:hypothetical protein
MVVAYNMSEMHQVHHIQHTGPAIDSAIAGMELGICATCTYAPFCEYHELKAKGLEQALQTRNEV